MVYCMDLPFFLGKKGRGRWLILACVFILIRIPCYVFVLFWNKVIIISRIINDIIETIYIAVILLLFRRSVRRMEFLM